MKTITEAEFKKLVNETLVVQFSASWCGPCKTLTKTIEANEDKFFHPVYKMDLDENRELAAVLQIRSVPTLIRFENNVEIKRLVGNQTLEQLLELTV
tara:strand:- start:641 stop:931 length:291 start_codon:yes stop_codon:yes gene_type:complete